VVEPKKKKKDNIRLVLVLLLFAAGVLGIFVYKRTAERNSLARQIASLSPRGAPPQTVEDLRKAIALYEKKIEEHVRDAAKAGVYWKILGSRLMDGAGKEPLYGQALEALENAVRYYPEDESIHYLIGVSSESLAQSEYFSPSEAAEHYRIAEAAYLRAIDINGRYGKALYGIGALYVFGLDRSSEAIPYLERFLEINKSDTSAMFVLARAYYVTEEDEKAVELYDRIISLGKSAEVKNQAEINKQQVLNR
jgi:tetratricopeptide (TPR) repeat protein